MFNSLNIKKIVYGAFVLFVGLNFLSAFLSPVDSETLVRYNISEFSLRLISASVLIPVVGIWACAAYGFVHFKQYALSIKGTGHGRGTNTIANGLGIIALQLLVTGGWSIISSVKQVNQALGGDRGVVVSSALMNVAFALASMVVIYQGVSQLASTAKRHAKPKLFTKSFYVLSLISAAYLISIFIKYPVDRSIDTIYAYVPISTAILLFGIPYILVWNLALMSIKKLYDYRKHVSGNVYKQALGLLTTGIYLIVGSSILIQMLGTLGAALANLKLLPLLAVLYVLILVIGIGYLYIAKAATRLRRVES